MVNSSTAVVGRDVAPEIGQVVYEIIGGTGADPQDDGALKVGVVAGKVTKVIGRLAANTQFSPTLSCGVVWEGSDEGMQLKKTGLGGIYDLLLSSNDPTHPHSKISSPERVNQSEENRESMCISVDPKDIAEEHSAVASPKETSIAPNEEKASLLEFASPEKSPSKPRRAKDKEPKEPAPLWRPGSFSLKRTARPCTAIDEFKNLTKSKKEQEIEAQRELRQLSREMSGSGSQLLRSDSNGSMPRTGSSGHFSSTGSASGLTRADSNLKSSVRGSLRTASGGEVQVGSSSGGGKAGLVRKGSQGAGYLSRSDSKNNVQRRGEADDPANLKEVGTGRPGPTIVTGDVGQWNT